MKNSRKKKISKSDMAFQIVAYMVFSFIFLICAYPFYYLLICTISDNKLVDLNAVTVLPRGVHFNNYMEVLKLERIRDSAIISVLRTVIGTGISLLVTAYMAYFFSKEIMWHRKLFYRLTVATMYFSAGIIPIYLNLKMFGLLNNFWVYVIPTCFSVYNMILVKTYMESLPGSLEESAEIDGAGYMVRFFMIVLPLSKPILATVGLFAAVAQWNSVFDTKLYVTNSKLYTMQFVLYEYYNQIKSIQQTMDQLGGSELVNASSTTSVRLTMTAVTVIPVMCIYPFIQKYYMKGIMIGAVKG
jgi:multiple sugar transport system permease protein/putative aldouronate transport system permease protein